MKKEEVKVRENLTMDKTEVVENGTQFMENLLQKLSDSTFKNVQSLSVEEEEMLLEDIDQEFIDKDTKTVLFLSIANGLVHDAKTYIEPREAFKKMHSEMKDSKNNPVEETLDTAQRAADAFSEAIDDSELHVIQVKENLVKLALKSYQTAIEIVTSPMELLSCAEHIAEELVDHEWASILFYEAVKWMDHLNTNDDMSFATVAVLLSDGTIELTPEQTRNILEILVRDNNVADHLERYAMLIKTLLGDDTWADEILERAKSVV